MSDAATNGVQSEDAEGRSRPYVVLEQRNLMDLVSVLFKHAEVGLGPDEWERIEAACKQDTGSLYAEVARLASRNSAHALTQVGRRRSSEGLTPPLVAVSERMFQPRQVNVSFDAKVSLS